MPITRANNRAARGNCAWGPSYDTGGRKEGWEREREFGRCYFLMQSARRPVFFLKDHQAGSKEICETERTNCQPGSQSRMTAFHSPAQLPTPVATPPPPACPPASHLPHPPLVTIIAWRRMIFQNSITHPLIPLIRGESVNRTSAGDFLGGKWKLDFGFSAQSHSLMYI